MTSVFDPLVILSGAGVGFVVGLTGMGGGALMTPILVLLFGIEPLTAVSSDIVASMVMKPIGGAVHWRRGTVHKPLVKWLMIGSIPSAFLGVLLLRKARARRGAAGARQGRAGRGAAGGRLRAGREAAAGHAPARRATASIPFVVKPLPTLLIGIVGGLIVGITSVGSGSLIIIMLLMLYPRMRALRAGRHGPGAGGAAGHQRRARSPAVRQLQAGPDGVDPDRQRPGRVHRRALLVARARLRDPPALMVVLLLSGLKLVNVPNKVLGTVAPIVIVGGVSYALWAWRRARRASAALAGSSLHAASVPVGISPAPTATAGVDRTGV